MGYFLNSYGTTSFSGAAVTGGPEYSMQ